jgi:hypothetical protein
MESQLKIDSFAQQGSNNYQQKYIKYKSKYLNVKNA